MKMTDFNRLPAGNPVSARGASSPHGGRRAARRLMAALLAGSFLTTLVPDPAEAQRRTLLEQWFPRAAERIREQRLDRLRRERPDLFATERQAAPVKKVTGPSYYTYKTEGLATFSLAGLLPAEPQAQPQPRALVGEDDPGSPTPADVDLSRTGAIEPVNPRLREEALVGWSLKIEGGIAEAIKDHYRADPDYLWVGNDLRPNEKASGLISALGRAATFGLSNEDYRVEVPAVASDRKAAEQAAARFELALTAAALRYAADAASGMIDPNKISGYHDFPKYGRDYKKYMQELASAEAPGAEVESLHPSNPRFAGLMSELAELRAQVDEDDVEPIAAGTLIRPGQESTELPKVIELINRRASEELKAQHGDVISGYDGRMLFDEPLVALVKDFQKENGLGADGIVGRNTIAKLHLESPKARIEKIEMAMERLRWHPHDLGRRYVVINQPAYRVNYVVNDKTELAMNVVVGKPSNQTSFFYDTIELVEVNPYWNVPRSILVNEMLGNIRANPGYLSSRNYEVVTAGGVTDPYAVDWYSSDGTKGVYVRQRPGSGNALGELKILFPNKHAIYMHDTPAKNLFSRSSRAYSHGCVRLADPRAMAAAVLETSKEQVGNYIAGGENKSIKVPNKMPVYIAYFTAWPDDEGKVHYYADVYGRDKALLSAMERTRELRSGSGIVVGS